MLTRSRRYALLATIGLLALTPYLPAHAQTVYPSKPIRMIVPLAAGSAVDAAARIITQKMSQNMGQGIVIENQPGAAGLIGADRVAKAAADGYTIFFRDVTALGSQRIGQAMTSAIGLMLVTSIQA